MADCPSSEADHFAPQCLDFPSHTNCSGCSDRWWYSTRLLEVWGRYALDLGLDVRLRGEELWSAAESSSSCSSNDGEVEMEAASLVCLADHLVASMCQVADGQLQPSPHWSCSGWWDGRAVRQCCERREGTKIPLSFPCWRSQELDQTVSYPVLAKRWRATLISCSPYQTPFKCIGPILTT